MNVSSLAIPGLVLIEPVVHLDERGALFEAWREPAYGNATGARFIQDNISFSHAGVLRALHFQHPEGQGKLLTVVSGAVFDVAVDVRRGSPTFGRWVSVELSAANARQLWIPPGFAHGMQALRDDTVMIFKITAGFRTEYNRTVLYSDPDLGIPWPLPNPTVHPRDAAAPSLKMLPPEHLPVYTG